MKYIDTILKTILLGSLPLAIVDALFGAPAAEGVQLAFGPMEALAIGGSFLGGLFGKKGAEEQADASREASMLAERARVKGLEELSDENLRSISDMFFPGLLPSPAPPAAQAGPTGPNLPPIPFGPLNLSPTESGVYRGLLDKYGQEELSEAIWVPIGKSKTRGYWQLPGGGTIHKGSLVPLDWGSGSLEEAAAWWGLKEKGSKLPPAKPWQPETPATREGFRKWVSDLEGQMALQQKFPDIFGAPQQQDTPPPLPQAPSSEVGQTYTLGPNDYHLGNDMVGSGPGVEPTPTTPLASGLPARQEGGPVQSGQPYLVGEKGPEVMVPTQSGQVLPAQQGGGATPMPQVPPQNQQQQEAPTPPPPLVGGLIGGGGGGGGGLGGLAHHGRLDQQPPQGSPQQDAPQPQAQAPSIGGLATEQTRGLLADPGQFGPQAYERRQEQANVGLNTALQAIPGGAAGSGIDPSSPAAKLLEQSAILGSQRMRHEAARQQDLLEEGMRREDIASGINQYLNYLNTIFSLAGRRAGTRSGGSFPQVSPINTQAPLGQGIATAGYLLGNYFQNQPQTQPTGQQPIVNAPPNVNFGVQNPFGG